MTVWGEGEDERKSNVWEGAKGGTTTESSSFMEERK